MWLDARIPVLIRSGTDRPDADARTVLLVADATPLDGVRCEGWAAVERIEAAALVAPPTHRAGCACCNGRPPLALLLSNLFQQRARGELGLFRQVVLMVDADQAGRVATLLCGDTLVTGRYRIS